MFFDGDGHLIQLGEPAGQGGEATVRCIVGDALRLAKLYDDPVNRSKQQKLLKMVSDPPPGISDYAAWPSSIVRDENGNVCGFVMPRVEGSELYSLYNPASRRRRFPAADWMTLVRTAVNCAKAVANIHELGIVIGDINQGNLMVDNRAIVRFIDCDSFQIRDGQSVHLCEVAVPHFTPPELQGADFSRVQRTVNHDRFGLAVLLFHLLFAGRHPYAGVYRGDEPLLVEGAIREHRFAFGKNRVQLRVEQPPWTARLSDVSDGVAELFERAFAPEAHAPNFRPAASDWVIALGSFEKKLVMCGSDNGHYHEKDRACPWCRIVGEGGPNLFDLYDVRESQLMELEKMIAGFDGASLMEGIRSLPRTTCSTMRLVPPVASEGDPVAVPARSHVINQGTGSSPLASFVQKGITATRKVVNNVKDWWTRYRDMQHAMRLLAEWDKRVRDRARSADEKIAKMRLEAERIWDELSDLRVRRREAIQGLQSTTEAEQRKEYLESHLICDRTFHHIGATLQARMDAEGVATAYDVDERRLMAIAGFGVARTQTMVEWRTELEAVFRFDPMKGVSPRKVQAVRLEFVRKEVELQQKLGTLSRSITTECGVVRRDLQAMLPERERLRSNASQAMLNARS